MATNSIEYCYEPSLVVPIDYWDLESAFSRLQAPIGVPYACEKRLVRFS